MRTEWKQNVYLAKSRIAGLGVFAKRDLEKHTMVVAYIGQLIRNEVAEKREKYYQQQVRTETSLLCTVQYVANGTGVLYS